MTAPAPYITACPVGCDAPFTPTRIVLTEGPLLECTACGQRVSQASAERYASTMRAFDEPDYNLPADRSVVRRRRVSNKRLERIVKLLETTPQDASLLDVGCSRGDFVAAAATHGFRAEGVEPAPQMAAAARASGLTVHEGLLDDVAFPPGSFDAVTLFEVIEHLREPLALMREIHRILRPGGVLCLTTGNAHSWTAAVMGNRWDYFDMDKDGGHVSFFNPRSIALLAERSAYATAAIETARVSLTSKEHSHPSVHAIAKPFAELLSLPARLAGRGHQMVAYLRRA